MAGAAVADIAHRPIPYGNIFSSYMSAIDAPPNKLERQFELQEGRNGCHKPVARAGEAKKPATKRRARIVEMLCASAVGT